MASAPTDVAPSPELLAISKHTSDLCKGITNVSTVTWFAQSLVQEGFITSDAKSSILHTTRFSEMDKCDRLLDAVMEQVRVNRAKFTSFVAIFRREPALSPHTDMVIATRGKSIDSYV